MSIYGAGPMNYIDANYTIRHGDDVIERARSLTDAELRQQIEMWAERCGRGWSGPADTSYLGILIGEQHARARR